ncbi:NAD(+) diphosphatase [Hansschlegelia zhihuaiae]|uniref:NAD(+) diphosphatase n=1 Tax=Hansschlegelia zhihuaiae TaxID=405005 RepID=A0A4Q0M6N2_9HYPH|nr:NAD(+) diphosphatase [Hansschlegelia zhihuaiae]RXF68721.1 NAD(+) diphosphatase [Hansschlegelia zhihuaiae]
MPDAESEPPLGYAGLAIDRRAERRDDSGFVDEEARHPAARTVLFLGDAPVLRRADDGGLDPLFESAVAGLGPVEPLAYLGRQRGAPRFGAQLGDGAAEAVDRADDLTTADLRAVASDGRLAGDALALAGYAKSLISWHARHRFCANCGAPSEPSPSGWRRTCPACGALHFPRVDPVAIMLVRLGDHCLLGRQSRFPPGMWSCLAGFVEPGETVEEAARREIMEEAGVGLGAVRYELSQPWPFPSQLMIGVSCEALTEEITPDLEELEDVRWFSRDEAAAMLRRDHPDGLFAPPPAAIAHHLLRRFVTGGA